MSKKYEATKPIYLQIVDQVCGQIARGEIRPGEKLPSVREMAIQSGVNPNTIQRSYTEMERMGIVEAKRGQGSFVIEDEEIVGRLQQSMQKEIIEQFVGNMKDLGFSSSQIISGLESYLKERDHHDDSLF
ncbi:GntR family transcriptional regulator [Lederbergia galactosidilytica]|uniref:Transcriptional regulator n=1 Tax=Lederbergia galactosidilytica TaxID=217031 RepID=A0A0Q9XUJ1_9BACI|nr:GntR family transcriptional regulator [Lederbergia galactosidilytica]KRG12005.1 transcriptional regulator [Lederbergia galactosidilytica]KRG12953.1 transcriptional regulator [Virgibacillus soli]OAK70182.1 transcriptional regulator [Lederbergia galactosidilytica]